MATNFLSAAAGGARPANTVTGAGQLTVNEGKYSLLAALVINDTIGLCKLPAGHVPVDFILDSDDLDTNGTPLITLSAGIVGGDTDAFFSTNDVAKAGGIARMDALAGRRLAPTNTERVVGLLVVAAPATGTASGVIKGTLISRPANLDD